MTAGTLVRVIASATHHERHGVVVDMPASLSNGWPVFVDFGDDGCWGDGRPCVKGYERHELYELPEVA